MEKTPLKLFKKRHCVESATPLKIPASPLMKKLGYGTGVAVYLYNNSARKARAQPSAQQSPWAIKTTLKDKTDKIYSERLLAEADILRNLSHPNIVGFRSFSRSDDGR